MRPKQNKKREDGEERKKTEGGRRKGKGKIEKTKPRKIKRAKTRNQRKGKRIAWRGKEHGAEEKQRAFSNRNRFQKTQREQVGIFSE